MAIYDTGTASLAANGKVTGVGTKWTMPLTLIRVGATIVFKTEPVQIYTISEITSDTSIAVYNPNNETVPAGTGYAILAHDGISVQGLAQDVAETLRYYQSRETEVATAVDTFNNFDQQEFADRVERIDLQYTTIQTTASQVSSDAAKVSSDKIAAASSASSAKNSQSAAASSAQEAANYAASLDAQNLLRKDLAFSDLTNKPLGRQNLDVYSKSEVDIIASGIIKAGTFSAGGTATSWRSALLNETNGYYYTPVSGTISVGAGSSPNSQWLAVGLLRGYQIKDVRNWSTNISPTVANDIANNTAAIQFMIDSLGAGSTIIFPAGFTTVVNRLDIKHPDMTICGGGVIDGTIRVFRETFATSSDIYMNCTIRDVLFSTSRGLADAIQLAYCRMGTITNIPDFRGYTNAIHILNNAAVGGTTANAWGQMVNRWIVSNCHYGKDGRNTVGRFIYAEASDGIAYPIADWIVKGNDGHATLDHILVTSAIDGLTVSDNIMFFPGYQTSSATKRSHIRIEGGGTWFQIHDNKFFESGGTSVYLNGTTRFSLHDNLYAFGAQNVPVPQIVVTGTPQSGAYFSQGVIHDETIVMPGGEGISIGAKQGRLKVHNCNIQNPSSSTYYYGSGAQPAANGILVDLDTVAVEVNNCTVREGAYSFADASNNLYKDNVIDAISSGKGLSYVSALKVLKLNSGSTVIDAGPWEAVEVSVASSFGLSSILNSGPTKMLTITNTGSNSFNIANSSAIRLAGSAAATLTPGSSITLRVSNGGNSTEVSRAII